jgi:hypothetical protein
MHTTVNQRLSATIFLLFLPILAYGQGLTWETATSVPMAGAQAINTTSYYLPRMFKQGSEKEAVVFRLDKQVMYSIDYEEKEYSEITFTELEAYIKKATDALKGQMEELKKQLASLPEDQRKAMEQMMGGQMSGGDDSAKVEVTKTSETKLISGYACTKYSIRKGAEEAAAVWTTTAVPDFGAMQKDFKEFGQRLASQMSINGKEMGVAMQQVEGFPVETSISGMTATVTKVAKATVAKSEFEVPAGFKKVPFEQMNDRHDEGMDEMPGDEGEGEDDDSDGGRY